MSENLNLEFSEEQAMMLETASAFCKNRSPIESVRSQLTEERGYDPRLWQELVDLGWLGMIIPEEFGGVGLGMAEVVCLMEPMGRQLLATPFMSTTLVAGALLQAGTADQQEQWLPAICTGLTAALALSEEHGDWDLANITCTASKVGDRLHLSGTKVLVSDADIADVFLVSVLLDDQPTLIVLNKSDLPPTALQREIVIDETRRCFRFCLEGIEISITNQLMKDKCADCLEYLDHGGCLLLSAEMCGGMTAAMDLTVEYLNTRQQFGRFIGSYQGLKHPMADILTQVEGARSLLYHAATTFEDRELRESAVRMVKAYVSDGFSYAGDRAVQFHGAMGFTYDCDAQLYLRRALWGQSQYGDAAYQKQRLETLFL